MFTQNLFTVKVLVYLQKSLKATLQNLIIGLKGVKKMLLQITKYTYWYAFVFLKPILPAYCN